MRKEPQDFAAPTEEEIARYAYYLWETEGRQHGKDLGYWLEAKAQLNADRQYMAGLFAAELGGEQEINKQKPDSGSPPQNVKKPRNLSSPAASVRA